MNRYAKIFLMSLASIILLTACSNNDNGDSDNLIDTGSAIEGSWVGYNGENVEDEEMLTSELIPYDSNKNYEINRSSYVSYFNGDEFIETKLYSDEMPATIETVEDADGIKVSINQYNKDAIELTAK